MSISVNTVRRLTKSFGMWKSVNFVGMILAIVLVCVPNVQAQEAIVEDTPLDLEIVGELVVGDHHAETMTMIDVPIQVQDLSMSLDRITF